MLKVERQGEDSEADGATEGKFVNFCAVADFPEANLSVPAGREEALTIREDASGNMVARTEGNQTTEFEYDYDNRLVKITYPNGSQVRFGYDGLGRRVFRQEGSNVRYFYYDGEALLHNSKAPKIRLFSVILMGKNLIQNPCQNKDISVEFKNPCSDWLLALLSALPFGNYATMPFLAKPSS